VLRAWLVNRVATVLRFLAPLMGCLILAGQANCAPVGDWLGVMTVQPGTDLRIAVHIRQSPRGDYSATWDSVDQGLFDASMSGLAVTADSLSFDVGNLHAHYAARWDASAGLWRGQWSQSGRTFALNLAPGMAPPAPVIAGLDGDWDGALALGAGVKLRLAVHIKTGPHGTLGHLDSVDQQAMGLPLSSIHRDGDRIGFELAAPKAAFEGMIDAKAQTLTGQWSQSGSSLPLMLTRRAPGQVEATLVRPQTPVKPYPYREEDVVFDGGAPNVRLAGTLTEPKGDGPFPAVVLVSGSGPNARNEAIFGHQIFLVLADHLTRQGNAVLRYDKRGVGASTGHYAKATTLDFVADAQAAAAYLRARKDIDPRRVGLVGHSEGGLIVPMVAVRDPSTAFIVMMAGPGVNGADILTLQGRLLTKAAGMSDAQVDAQSALRAQMIAIVRDEKDPAVAEAKLRAVAAAAPKLEGVSPAAMDAQIRALNTDWFRFFFNYDPAPVLRQVRCPVLAISGSKDLQVPPDQNLPAIRAALAHDPDADIEELPGLNHLFQTAKTGGIGEYGQIEETIAPLALDTFTLWILKHDGARN